MSLATDQELNDFKTVINLTEYAASRGYELDRRESGRNSVVMRHPNGDKVIVAKDTDGHWIYFSVRDSTDHGSIIDFIQKRKRLNLGEVRKELRAWTGLTSLPYRPAASSFVTDLKPIARDLVGVRACWEAARAIEGHHPYLEGVRRIPAVLLASERFGSRIRIDDHGNAVFPHWNKDGLCGFELKNDGFTGFAPGGLKGLWGSRTNDGDNRLVIAETAIDALSYAALKGFDRTRFVSIAGAMNDEQPGLLLYAAKKLPPGSLIVGAFDNDEAGDAFLTKVRMILKGKDVIDDRPVERGEDWNDVVRFRLKARS